MQPIATLSKPKSSFNANVYKGIIRISLQSVEVGCKARSALLTRRSQVGLLPGPPITSNKYVGLVLIGTQGYVEIINLLRYQPWCGSARLRFALHVILD
jgi:hypothetical protein